MEMKIKLLQAWKHWSVGHVFTDMPDNQASELIRRHIAAEDVPEQKTRGGRVRAGMRAGADYVTR
jgi:hypothetical protein